MALILYASELAACIGMNKYKAVEEAKLSVWQRWNPSSYQMTNESQKSVEEVYASLPSNVRNIVSRAVSSETEKDATQVMQNAMNEKANVATDEVVKAILLAKSNKKDVDEACRAFVGARQLTDTLNKSLAHDCSSADVKKCIDSVRVKDVEEAKASVVREVNTRRGENNEHKGIASYEASKRVKLSDKNSKFHKKPIGETCLGTTVYVGGRVDGLTSDKVVEVKCRRNRIFKTLPLYEKVQTQAYLFLTDKPVVEVVQKYDGFVCSDEYNADLEFWDEVCKAALTFASDLEQQILRSLSKTRL